MARGTIHAVDDDLFLVEGEWPDDPAAPEPGSAVLRSGDRLVLLDTGSGPEQRSAVRAIIASFPAPAELLLINSGGHPGLVGNNDLLESSLADRRTLASHRGDHAPPPAGHESRSCRSATGGRVVVELRSIAAPVCVASGAATWRGWRLPDVTAIEVTARTARLAFWLPRQRTLLLPDEFVLAPACPGSSLADVHRVGLAVLGLLDAGEVEVVGLGFGGPLGAGSARERIQELVGRAASRPSDRRGA